MTSPLWLLTDPSGRVVGASVHSAVHAAADAWAVVLISTATENAFLRSIEENPTASTYTVDGYTLERQEMDG